MKLNSSLSNNTYVFQYNFIHFIKPVDMIHFIYCLIIILEYIERKMNYILKSCFRNMRQTLISYKWNRVFDCRQFQIIFTTVIYLNGFLYRSLYRHVVVNRKELNVSFIKETPQNLTRWSNEKTVLHFLLRKSRTTRHEWT